MKAWLNRTAAVAAILLALGLLLDSLVLGSPAMAHGLPWKILAALLSAGLLVGLGQRLPGPDLRRAAVLFATAFGIDAASLVEASLFDLPIPAEHVSGLWLAALVHSGAAAVCVAWRLALVGARHEPGCERGWLSWAVRFLSAAVFYAACYLVAGILVLPHVEAFYQGRAMPGGGAILLIALGRGVVFTAIVALLARSLSTGGRTRAVLSGLAFSLLGGVVPLVVPNPYMPDGVRLAHLVEVGVSNLVFGYVAARLLARPAAPGPPVVAAV